MYFTFPLDTFIDDIVKRKPDTDTSEQININTTLYQQIVTILILHYSNRYEENH